MFLSLPLQAALELGVKIVFIYHVRYGSLLVRCHRVVNKGSRLPAVRAFTAPCVWHTLHPVFAHSLRIPLRLGLVGRKKVWKSYIHDMGGSQAVLL